MHFNRPLNPLKWLGGRLICLLGQPQILLEIISKLEWIFVGLLQFSFGLKLIPMDVLIKEDSSGWMRGELLEALMWTRFGRFFSQSWTAPEIYSCQYLGGSTENSFSLGTWTEENKIRSWLKIKLQRDQGKLQKPLEPGNHGTFSTPVD